MVGMAVVEWFPQPVVGGDVEPEYLCMGKLVASYLTVSIMISCPTTITANDPLVLCMSSLQLSQLVIMTEDTQVERAISGPVETVHAAVANLIKVGGIRQVCGLFAFSLTHVFV